MQMAIDELIEQTKKLEGQFEAVDRRLARLERVWHKFRKERGIPVHATTPIRIPPRPRCLRDLNIGRDPEPEEESTDAG